MTYITRKDLNEDYRIPKSTINQRIKSGYYRTNDKGDVLLDDVYKLLKEQPRVGRKPKIKNYDFKEKK